MLKQNDPKSLINRWPATMFADKRTESVIGRIRFLTSSIITIKFISWTGVPVGTICAIIVLKLFFHPNLINLNQNRIAIVKEMDRWAVGVKVNGVKAIILVKRHPKNSIIRILEDIFLMLGAIRDFSSFDKNILRE